MSGEDLGPQSGPSAELRAVRLLTVGVGLASALALALLLQAEHSGAAWRPTVDRGWFRSLGLATMVAPVVVGVVAVRLGTTTLRWLNGGLVVVSLAVLPAAVALNATSPPGDRHLPWMLTTIAPVALAALLAGGTRLVAVAIGVTVAGNQALRWWTDHYTYAAVINDLHALLTAVVLVSLATSLLHAASRADAAAESSREREAERVAAEARDAARERAAAVVHDEVLVTLLLAARASTGALRDAVRRQARQALAQIRRLADTESDGVDGLSTAEAVARLRSVTSSEDRTAGFVVRGTLAGDVSGEAVEALGGALRQALANSVRHAGSTARRTVRVTAGPGAVDVLVHDDGVGFDPAGVPPPRMGIAVSIVGRMRTLVGGDARIDARPGGGTTVTLTWRSGDVAASAPDAAPRWLSPIAQVVSRRGWWTVATTFVGGQLLLAVLAAAASPDGMVPVVLTLIGVLVAATLVWRPTASTPGRGRGVAAVVVLVAVSAVTCAQDAVPDQSYVQLWYLTSAALVLVGLAVAGRPWSAVLGAVATAATVAWGVAAGRVVPVDAIVALARAINIVAFGVLLVVASRRVQSASARAEAAELLAHQVRARRRARRAELAVRGGELERLVGARLERIADGPPLTADDRRACAALEGRLRDLHRGGRLARPPLIAAAMDARARGVDVTLLDDARHRIDDAELERIARWMQTRLVRLDAGRFTGRILPPGRDAVASVVAGDEVAVLPAVTAEDRDCAPVTDAEGGGGEPAALREPAAG